VHLLVLFTRIVTMHVHMILKFLGLLWMGSEKKVIWYIVPWQCDSHHFCVMPWLIIHVDMVALGGSCH